MPGNSFKPHDTMSRYEPDYDGPYTCFQETLGDLCNDIAPRRELHDYLKIFLVLRAWKTGAVLSLSPDGTLQGLNSKKDSLTERIYSIAGMSFGYNDFSGFEQLFHDYSNLKKEEYDRRYLQTVDFVLSCFPVQLFRGTNALPPFHISRTIASYLERHGCRSVFNPRAGISSLALALKKDIRYSCQEPSAIVSLFGDILLDAAGLTVTEDVDSTPDALVSILPVDYYFDEEDKWDRDQVKKGGAQYTYFNDALKERKACKVIIGLIHHQVANQRFFKELRQDIVKSGWLDIVITYPDDTFQDAKVLTSLVFINLEKTDRMVTFIAPEKTLEERASFSLGITEKDFDVIKEARDSERVSVPLEELEKTDYSFNAYVYIPPDTKKEGQELVRLSDLVEYGIRSPKLMPENGKTILDSSFSREVSIAIEQVSLDNPRNNYASYSTTSRPAVFFRVNKDWGISACVNLRSQKCYYQDPAHALLPKDGKILPEYLAYILLTDSSLQQYLRHIHEYYSDGWFVSSHLMYHKVAVYTDLRKQREVLSWYKPMEPEEFRSYYPGFFEAADWVDKAFGMEICETFLAYLRNNHSFPNDPANRPYNTIRTLTHFIIGKMEDLELVPPLDKGAVPTFLSQRSYKDRNGSVYQLVKPLMEDSMVSIMQYLCTIGSEGSHSLIDNENMRYDVLSSFMAFTQWIYGHKELFETKGIGYFTEKTPYETSSKAGKKQITGTVRRVCIGGGEYLCCENVHLFVDRRNPKVREGDTVIIRDYVEEGKEELRETGITLFAKNTKCYRKVNG